MAVVVTKNLHAISKTNTEVLGEVIDQARQMGYTFELFQ